MFSELLADHRDAWQRWGAGVDDKADSEELLTVIAVARKQAEWMEDKDTEIKGGLVSPYLNAQERKPLCIWVITLTVLLNPTHILWWSLAPAVHPNMFALSVNTEFYEVVAVV